MSDARLRAAARAHEQERSPDTHAALLRERVRAGELPQAMLELAAYCGSLGARLAVGLPGDGHGVGCWPRFGPEATHIEIERWPQALGHAAFGAAEAWAAPICPCAWDVATALDACAAQLLCPCEAHRRPLAPPSVSDDPQPISWLAAGLSLFYPSAAKEQLLRAVDEAAQRLGPEVTRSAITSALVPWALGEGCPLKARAWALSPERAQGGRAWEIWRRYEGHHRQATPRSVLVDRKPGRLADWSWADPKSTEAAQAWERSLLVEGPWLVVSLSARPAGTAFTITRIA